MTHTALKAAIQEIILDYTGGEITCDIHIKDLTDNVGNHIGYEVGFEDHQYQPTWYSASLPDDEFLKFIREQLRTAAFVSRKRYSTQRNTTTFRQNPFV